MRIFIGRLFFIILATTGTTFATEYPAQKVNRVDMVHFGQAQSEVEHLLGKKAVTEESVIDRLGIDYSLEIPGAKIEFDTGKLVSVTFEEDFKFATSIVMFPEGWRNLDPIGKRQLKRGMQRTEFLEYLKLWEARAKEQGAKRNDGDDLLRAGEYTIHITQEDLFDMISIGFGPERSTGKGGVWGSSCIVSFLTPQVAPLYGRKSGTLDSISVLCDEFNTHARHRKTPESAPGETMDVKH